mgnify:FL=1
MRLLCPGALDRIGRYKEDDLVRGWIAYGALSAAQSPTFAAGIASVEKRYGKAAVIKALLADPAYPSRRKGYGDAIGALLDASAEDRAAIAAAAARLDHPPTFPWSETIDGDARAARLKKLDAAPALAASVRLPAHNPALKLAPGKATLARKMTSLAALAMLNAPDSAGMTRMMDDKPARECVRMQLLQFYQCVSVTHDASEGAQCLAAHALRGVNGCLDGALVR